MDFGRALRAANDGERITRPSWNGKGMWVALMPAQYVMPSQLLASPGLYRWAWRHAEINAKTLETIRIEPFLIMKTADDTLVYGWLASQTDMLADDWLIVEGDE
jgi:hypothetical protein